MRFDITIYGKSAHAGLAPDEGISAILELSHQVQHLFALNDPARGVTVNVGTIDGGLRPNAVAPAASPEDDVRAQAAVAVRSPAKAGRGLTPELPGARIEVEGGFGRPPMEPLPGNRALLAAAVRLGRELGLTIEDAGLVGGGSDANTTSSFTATLDGLGPIGAGSHEVDERVDVEHLPERVALLALLLLEPPLRQGAQ
jgi:glutamate carboxypeptidase